MNEAARKLGVWLAGRKSGPTRLKKGDFAKGIGISPSFLSRLLSGERKPALELAEAIEEVTDGFVSMRGWNIEVRRDLTENPKQCIGA